MEVNDELLKLSAENTELRVRVDALEKLIAVLIHDGVLIRPVCGGAGPPDGTFNRVLANQVIAPLILGQDLQGAEGASLTLDSRQGTPPHITASGFANMFAVAVPSGAGGTMAGLNLQGGSKYSIRMDVTDNSAAIRFMKGGSELFKIEHS